MIADHIARIDAFMILIIVLALLFIGYWTIHFIVEFIAAVIYSIRDQKAIRGQKKRGEI